MNQVFYDEIGEIASNGVPFRARPDEPLGRVTAINHMSDRPEITLEVETLYPHKLMELMKREIHPMNDTMRIIYSGPCTILIWKDWESYRDKKVIVRCTDTEKFDWRKGALMALIKARFSTDDWKAFANRYHDHPNKEHNAAEAILRYEMGDDVVDWYISKAKEAWKASKK